LLAFPATSDPSLFPCRGGSDRCYRPLYELRPGSSFLGVLLLRVPSLHFSRSYLSVRALAYPGFRPSSRHHRGASTRCEGCHALTMFRPQAFSASRRFAPPSGFASLFHLAATSRVVAVQGVLSPRSRPTSSVVLAPLPFSFHLPRCTEVHDSSRRIRPPSPFRGRSMRRGRLDSEAFIHARPRSLRFGVSLPASRSPLRFSVSSRSSTAAFATDYPAASTHGVAGSTLRKALLHSRSPEEGRGSPPASVSSSLGRVSRVAPRPRLLFASEYRPTCPKLSNLPSEVSMVTPSDEVHYVTF
jgi:hypothetical protein